jgi:hypothetical protein
LRTGSCCVSSTAGRSSSSSASPPVPFPSRYREAPPQRCCCLQGETAALALVAVQELTTALRPVVVPDCCAPTVCSFVRLKHDDFHRRFCGCQLFTLRGLKAMSCTTTSALTCARYQQRTVVEVALISHTDESLCRRRSRSGVQSFDGAHREDNGYVSSFKHCGAL